MITVMGATGNTGRVVSETLLAAGEKIRVLGRSAERLQGFVDKGAEAWVGDAKDAAFLTKAFTGADGVYAMLPPDPKSDDYLGNYRQEGEAVTAAVKASGVKHVVFLSSVGAQLESGTGPIVGLGDQERRFAAIDGLNVVNLRAGWFMENFFGSLGMIKQMGANGGPLRGDVPMAIIATRDIGEIAAKLLIERSWTGCVDRELLGPRDLTMVEATTIIGKAIGLPDLAYNQFPYDQAAAAFVATGHFSQNFADLFMEMAKGFNDGVAGRLQERGPETNTPTELTDFAKVLADAYASM